MTRIFFEIRDLDGRLRAGTATFYKDGQNLGSTTHSVVGLGLALAEGTYTIYWESASKDAALTKTITVANKDLRGVWHASYVPKLGMVTGVTQAKAPPKLGLVTGFVQMKAPIMVDLMPAYTASTVPAMMPETLDLASVEVDSSQLTEPPQKAIGTQPKGPLTMPWYAKAGFAVLAGALIWAMVRSK